MGEDWAQPRHVFLGNVHFPKNFASQKVRNITSKLEPPPQEERCLISSEKDTKIFLHQNLRKKTGT